MFRPNSNLALTVHTENVEATVMIHTNLSNHKFVIFRYDAITCTLVMHNAGLGPQCQSISSDSPQTAYKQVTAQSVGTPGFLFQKYFLL